MAAGQVRFVMLGELSIASRLMGAESAGRPLADWIRANGTPVDPALWSESGVPGPGLATGALRPETGRGPRSGLLRGDHAWASDARVFAEAVVGSRSGWRVGRCWAVARPRPLAPTRSSVFSAGAVRAIVTELAQAFQQETGHKVAL